MQDEQGGQRAINPSELLPNYPSDAISSIKEALENGENIHIHGQRESGKSTLLRLLAQEFSKEPYALFIPQWYDVYDKHEDLPLATFLPPGLDYWHILQKKKPEVVIVDGDDSLQAKNGKQFPSGEPIEEEFLPYQHEHTLWTMTNQHIQVISAGEHSVPEMNEHLKEYGMGAYGMNYGLDIEIVKETSHNGNIRFNLMVKDVKYIRTQKIEGMRSMLQSISKGNLPQ